MAVDICQILYPGLGGQGNTASTLDDSDLSHEWNISYLFYGIEDIREDYIQRCKNNK